ncbi:MAG: hypothetical protein JXR53_08365 [Bacteroidales bacterium]|nr:hypothetical protein [Bacteroidales bacterium]
MKNLFYILALVFFVSCQNDDKTKADYKGIKANRAKKSEIANTELNNAEYLLHQMIGEHYIASITIEGNNNLKRIKKEGNEWKTIGQEMINYQITDYNFTLSATEIQKIESLKIVIGKDLSIGIFRNNERIVYHTFNEYKESMFLQYSSLIILMENNMNDILTQKVNVYSSEGNNMQIECDKASITMKISEMEFSAENADGSHNRATYYFEKAE